MKNSFSKMLVLLILILVAAMIRFWAAPRSAGPDIPQFWSFAKVFSEEGFKFYNFAGAEREIFPYEGWSYNYTPIWLLILYGVYLLAEPDDATTQFVDVSWRVGMKIPLIISDLLIGVLIYLLVSGSYLRKIAFSSLWLFSPIAWYESSVFGQFDSLTAFFLLSGFFLFEKKRESWAFFFFALSVLTKQHTAVCVLYVLLSRWSSWTLRSKILNLSILFAVGSLISLPFILIGGLGSYLHYVFLPAGWLRYQVPLIYAFSGIGSFLTYVRGVTGKETLFIMQGMKYVQLISFLLTGFLIFKRKICFPRAALLGFFVLLGLSSSVNYQYLVGYIPLALYWASRTTFSEEKFLLLILSVYPSLWLWTFDVGFWFRFMQPTIEGSQELLSYLGLTREALPNGFYVCFVVVLMFFFLSYIFGTILRWSEKKDTTTSTN